MKGHREKVFLALAMSALGLLGVPAAAAGAVEHPPLGNFGVENQPVFEEAQALAVDQQSGDLLVVDRAAGTLSRFHEDGTVSNFSALGVNVISGFDFGNFVDAGEVQVAVDNSGGATDGDIYVTEPGASAKSVDIFDRNGNSVGQLIKSSEGSFNEPCGVSVDSLGNVYVGDFSGKIHKFENPPVDGESTELTFSQDCTLAAGDGPTDGFIFPIHFDGSATKLVASAPGAEKYVVDPGPATTDSVDPASGLLFVAIGSEVKEYDVSGPSEAVPLTPIAAGGEEVTGVAVDETTHNIYVARKGTSHIEVWGPSAELPQATTEAASVVGNTVTFHGVVGADGGPPTSCVFQYVEVSAKGFAGASSVPCAPAGPFTGSGLSSVSAEVSGLPEAAYRFRLLASNESGSRPGGEQLFNTFERVGLPDGRAYEMVSPALKTGEVIPPEPSSNLGGSCSECLPGINVKTMPMQSAPDGGAVLYEGQPFTGGLASGPNEYLSGRGHSGWVGQSLSLPAITGRYEAFSADLSSGVLYQVEPTLSPEAPTRGVKGFADLYLRAEDGSMRPLVTEEPPNRDAGTPLQFQNQFRVRYSGANAGTPTEPSFAHLLFEANDALTEEVEGIAPKAPEVEAGEECTFPGANCNLYEWESGQLRLVNVLPENDEVASEAVIGSGRLLVEVPPLEAANIDHAISADGSRIFWSTEETGEIYVRLNANKTMQIPGAGSCKESVPLKERVCFLTASADGSRAMLSDGQIYELNESGSAYEPTIDLSEGEGGFQGILGAAENLSRVYFVDEEALTSESEENANGEHAEAGEFNLYAWGEGASTFIGILGKRDNSSSGIGGQYGDWKTSRPNRTAQVNPDGTHLAFMSQASLTGYDNTRRGGGTCNSDSSLGAVCLEVFEFAADSDKLTCASCNPSGQRPLGRSNLSLLRPAVVDSLSTAPSSPNNLSQNGDGRLFFESQDALSSADINGHIQDVYEWEPNEMGSCKRPDGCVYLISSGHSADDSMFVDSTPNGNDAFFITREQLLSQDKNEQLDLYDARAGGGFSELTTAPCEGEACVGPIASPPGQPSAGSAGFSGPGNPSRLKPKPKKPKSHKRNHHKKHHNHGGHR